MNVAYANQSEFPTAAVLIDRLVTGGRVYGADILAALRHDIVNGYRVGRGSIVNLVRDNPDMSRDERHLLCELLRRGIAEHRSKRPSLALVYDGALKTCLDLL